MPLPIATRAVLDRVIAGEYPMGLEMVNAHVAISAGMGAPVRWVPLDATTTTLQVAGVTAGAPHPNAGRLFLDFITSRAGQEIFREVNYIPMHPDIPAKDPTTQGRARRLQVDRAQPGRSRHQCAALCQNLPDHLPLKAHPELHFSRHRRTLNPEMSAPCVFCFLNQAPKRSAALRSRKDRGAAQHLRLARHQGRDRLSGRLRRLESYSRPSARKARSTGCIT